MKSELKTIASQPSWVLSSKHVEVAITELGGHMAPVTFYKDTPNPVQPYFISPWQYEKKTIDMPVLVPLRGDFFCMPFGPGRVRKDKPIVYHGESASTAWSLKSREKKDGLTQLLLSMKTKDEPGPGEITKIISLKDGHNVVYIQHVLEGYSCKTSIAHHATLAVPETVDALQVSTSPILFGFTNPGTTGPGDSSEYFFMPAGARFSSLKKVPTIWKDKPFDDLTQFPRRDGFGGLLSIFSKQSKTPAWTTATVASQGYLWFALKDPAMLPATVFWIENRGRHGTPWNGRTRCIGLEDVCSYFGAGIEASIKKNPLNDEGIETCVTLTAKKPTLVNYIQGVVKVPKGFDKVNTVKFGKNSATFVSASGLSVETPVDYQFLYSGTIA